MGAAERLSLDDVRVPNLMSAHHIHRYALASRLCRDLRVVDLACGVGYGSELMATSGAQSVLGVDLAEDALSAARRAYDGHGNIRFERADALGWLRRSDPADFDAVVAFEALEHLSSLPETLERLSELAEQGVRLLLSVPNSRAFHEVNEFHLTDFGFDEARAAFDRFEGIYLYQHIAEGSLIVPADGPVDFDAEVTALDRAEPEYANTFLVAVGFPKEDLDRAGAQLNVVAAPNHNRYMLELQAANEELWRTNMRLAQSRLGKSDAAAASAQHKIDEYRAQLKDCEARIAELTDVARHNDELYRQQLAFHDAARFRLANAIYFRAKAIPGLVTVLRLAKRLARL